MAQQLKTDRILFSTIVLMVCFGLVMVYSASSVTAGVRFQNAQHFLIRQMGWAAAAFAVLMYFKRKDYRTLSAPTWAFAPLGIIMALLVVAYFRDPRAHRWLNIGSVGIQPSEFAKPALVVFLAWFMTRRVHAINTRYTIGPAALALGVLAGSIISADMGSAAVLMATAGAIFFVAGLQPRYFAMAMAAGLVVSSLAILAKPYRILRVTGYFDPENKILNVIDSKGWLKSHSDKSLASRDVEYQGRQSRIAVGSGGVLGVGLMKSKQKIFFLPEAHNDFMFAIIGEELGLWGAIAVLMGFLVIFYRGIRLYWTVPDDFGRFLALGVSVLVLVQALIHMSVVLELVPNKGIPLPMISYGGSSLLTTLTSFGILLSVSDHAG
ncbi:MAG TPA: putative peptidoglycan glycosyltransferase FtsW [Bryobacteraceae bacterium]|nr:putative peptidoglycan glycosyltransferase FtsW [Bryobacteraceae bacterium]